MIENIIGNSDFIESLRGKEATFLLALSNTQTANIRGITQAGIPGKIYLTPTLDGEFLCTGEVRSLDNVPTTLKNVPTPALLSRAVHLLHPYKNIELLDLGLEVKPKIEYFKIHDFGFAPSKSIALDAGINAIEIFQKGLDFAQKFAQEFNNNEYIILGESVPSGTTTASAVAQSLAYNCKDLFSSSFKNVPNNVKDQTISNALKNIKAEDDLFQILGKVSDNMLIFNAGFILGLNNKIKLILAGGTQMACVLLIVNSILKTMGGEFETSNLALCTTKWIFEDKNSDIKALLELLDFKINAYYSDFDFSSSEHPSLKLYDEGEAKEGVGAGASLIYASLNGLEKEQIIKKIESFLG